MQLFTTNANSDLKLFIILQNIIKKNVEPTSIFKGLLAQQIIRLLIHTTIGTA